MEELINTGQADVVGRLAFKYMEMCKVDSSSDSESETSPRWSDVSSSKGCDSSTPETRGARQRPQRCRTLNYQQCLDPYDGSSEDSGSSTEGSMRPGGAAVKATGRRSALRDVQMRSSSGSELDSCSPCRSRWCAAADLSDSGFNSRSCIGSPAVTDLQLQDTPPDGSSVQAALPKRKFFPPSGELDDGMRRKRQCISDMEV